MVAQGGLISPVLFSLYDNDMPSPSHHVELALYAEDTAVIANARKPKLLVSYLESYLNDHKCFQEQRDDFRTCRTALHPAPTRQTIRGTNPMYRDYALSGVTLDKRLTWSLHIVHIRKKTAQKKGLLGPLLNTKSDLSVRNGVLLYKQLIRPMIDYACPAWRSAARTHVRRLQVLQSKCLRLATGAPWYVSNRQIHEDLGVPLFADHIRALTASFDSKLADAGNPLVRQLGRYLR